MKILLALLPLLASAQTSAPNVAIPLAGLPSPQPTMYEVTTVGGAASFRTVKADASTQRIPQPDGSLLISAIPSAPTPLQLVSVLWVPFTLATVQTGGRGQTWCSELPLPPNWQPAAVLEARVNVPTEAPTAYQLFYLISSPAAAGATPTADTGLTWTRSSPACNGKGAIMYTPTSLPATDQRMQIYAIVAS